MLYNEKMIKLTIEKNDENQRLDRFLKKYYGKASLSFIYKMIRKDVKINGKRGKAETVLHEGDQLQVYLSDEDGEALRTKQKTYRTKRQFEIAYEDEDLLIVEKPFGLLTHGDAVEKKNTLANQVCGYLMSKGEYSPGREQTFVPAPVNRLDRNTTGLVIFGKNAATVKEMNQMIRERGQIQKKYLTIVAGNLTKPIELKDKMIKDENRNVVEIVGADQEGKVMETIATPLKTTGEYTLVEVEL
ncbi:MAG: RluA family pseudouridine synthase, partial [Anaerovoracaceae bacterium]